ncbi:hypothetical protein O9993_06355 [Vibrio lentus]|nr:hypothetical protein [Vibrio lentus]
MSYFFFFGVDQREPDHAPGLAFVSTHDGVVWDDGNGRFYGLITPTWKHFA